MIQEISMRQRIMLLDGAGHYRKTASPIFFKFI